MLESLTVNSLYLKGFCFGFCFVSYLLHSTGRNAFYVMIWLVRLVIDRRQADRPHTHTRHKHTQNFHEIIPLVYVVHTDIMKFVFLSSPMLCYSTIFWSFAIKLIPLSVFEVQHCNLKSTGLQFLAIRKQGKKIGLTLVFYFLEHFPILFPLISR